VTPVPTGTPTPSGKPDTVVNTVAVTVGGQQANVSSASLVAGQIAVYAVTVTLPSSGLPNGPQQVQLTVTSGGNSLFGSNTVNMNFVAQAVVTTPALILVNNYSGVLPGLPNYGIAQGAIFDVYGKGLANTSTSLQNPPLQTTLSGVTVNVTVNGTTVHPPIYFVTPGQLGLILPSNTPVGDGQISVVNNGTTIGPSPIHVVQSAFGILTLNGLGTGIAAMYDVNFNLVGLTNSLQPGETVNLFGSGIGPSPDSDSNVIAAPTNLVGAFPITVTVGGQQAQVTYAGRTIYPGLDQVQVVIPKSVTPGCYLSVVVRTGNIVSNFGKIPVASSGRICSEPTLNLTPANFAAAAAKGIFNLGVMFLGKETDSQPGKANSSSVQDSLEGEFIATTTTAFGAADTNSPTTGSCTLYSWSGQDSGAPGGIGPGNVLPLNAGPAINITGPNTKVSVTQQNGGYKATIGGAAGSAALPIFIPPAVAGSYTFDNGSGGPDVKAFTATVTATTAPTWTNQNTVASINRSSPPTLTWSGGSAGYYAGIGGSFSTNGPVGTVGVTFVCAVPSTDGQFTFPQDLLLSLPPTPAGGPAGGLGLDFISFPTSFTAPGIDVGFIRIDTNQVSLGVTIQ
jgi:uncharacterized protein (TIGR03437 family)